MANQPDMWCGTVEQVGDDGFVVALMNNEGVVAVDERPPGICVGMVAVFYTTGEVDEEGNSVVECDFTDPTKELAN